MPGMEFSMGTEVGPTAWELTAEHLNYAWIAPPEGFAGAAEIVAELRLSDGEIVDRKILQLTWVDPTLSVAGPRQPVERSIPPESAPLQAPLEQSVAAGSLLGTAATEAPVHSIIAVSPPEQPEVRAELPSAPLFVLDRSEAPRVLELRLETIQLKPDHEKTTAAAPPASPQRATEREDITMFLKRGKQLFASGDLSAARVMLRKAADANNAEAALALAATYDPHVLRELRAYGILPDLALARVWYEKASELGSPGALRRLEILSKETGAR